MYYLTDERLTVASRGERGCDGAKIADLFEVVMILRSRERARQQKVALTVTTKNAKVVEMAEQVALFLNTVGIDAHTEIKDRPSMPPAPYRSTPQEEGTNTTLELASVRLSWMHRFELSNVCRKNLGMGETFNFTEDDLRAKIFEAFKIGSVDLDDLPECAAEHLQP